MRSAINRIGRNHALVILETSVLVSTALYTVMMDRSPILAEGFLPYFLIRTAVPNNIILYGITQRLIFGPLPNKLVSNPPLREGWRKWFFLFQVLALLLCCYLRLNHDDEEEFPL